MLSRFTGRWLRYWNWSGGGESNPYRLLHRQRCFQIHHAPDKIKRFFNAANAVPQVTCVTKYNISIVNREPNTYCYFSVLLKDCPQSTQDTSVFITSSVLTRSTTPLGLWQIGGWRWVSIDPLYWHHPKLAPEAGIEPATFRLTVECIYLAELLWNWNWWGQ